MSYKEKEIFKEQLEGLLEVLDSDEGIRIDDSNFHIFINKTSKRYCIDILENNKDEFVYRYNVKEVLDFLRKKTSENSKIFSY